MGPLKHRKFWLIRLPLLTALIVLANAFLGIFNVQPFAMAFTQDKTTPEQVEAYQPNSSSSPTAININLPDVSGALINMISLSIGDNSSAPVTVPVADVLNQINQVLQPSKIDNPDPIQFNGKGTVEDGYFYSPVLDRNRPYRIYMPPGYGETTQRYPVLYMLHGLSGSYKEWVDYKLIDTVDALIVAGKIKPVLVVLPSGDQEYWVDHADGGKQWGLYVAHDVVGYIDATYRTLPTRQNRAVGGLSMGGYGAIQLAFNYPEVFGIAGGHSPVLRARSEAPDFLGDINFYEAHDPVSLAQTLPEGTLKSLNIWLDIGDQDSWLPRVQQLAQVLTDRGIPYHLSVLPGTHGGEYWIANVGKYLQFYGDSLAGK